MNDINSYTPDLSTVNPDELTEYLIDHPSFIDKCNLEILDG